LAGANVGHRAVQHHAGIVDERVQTPQLGDRTRNCAGRLLLVSDVALQHQCGAAIATATTLSCQRGRLMAASHVGTVVDNYTDPATRELLAGLTAGHRACGGPMPGVRR
jgi:hypothetical protein